MTTHTVGDVSEFEEGKGKRVVVGTIPIAIFNIDGTFYGIVDNCPHKNLPLHPAGHDRYVSPELEERGIEFDPKGFVDREKCSVRCPWHQWEWDLQTGENHRPKTDDRVPTFDVTVTDGKVQVEI